MNDEQMSLERALYILADGHTRDDDFSGYIVLTSRDSLSRFKRTSYIAAWGVVRKHLRMQVEPKTSDTRP